MKPETYNIVMPDGSEIYMTKSSSWYNTIAIVIEEYQCNDIKKKEVFHSSNHKKGNDLYDIIKKEWDVRFDDAKKNHLKVGTEHLYTK